MFFIHFKPNKTKNFNDEGENCDLLMDNIKIKKVQKAKFLGVIIDQNLSWVEHTKNHKRSLSFATATINRIKDNLPINLNKVLYFTLFESHLIILHISLGGAAQCHLTPIWMSQKHCIRITGQFVHSQQLIRKTMVMVYATYSNFKLINKVYDKRRRSLRRVWLIMILIQKSVLARVVM